jgi:hypothetical protein
MARWEDFEAEAPELAAEARRLLEAHTHLTIATLRRDGSPRISGTELRFAEGELYIGSMWQAVKAHDLQRDPRYALHSGSIDPPAWEGDAKVAGLAEEITDPERVLAINGAEVGPSHLFRLDVREVVVVALNDRHDKLVIRSWHAGRGTSRLER